MNSESTYNLPFVPDYATAGNFDKIGMSLNATHFESGGKEYDLHSLYGHMMSYRFNQYMTQSAATSGYNTDNRPFLLTRSSFSGTGQYASHWLGDNWRDWDYMRYSVAGIMNMNMFGIPHVGADVCGFFG
jgi:alpha-glucosidase (family GH31 glycosyl hydrolase)